VRDTERTNKKRGHGEKAAPRSGRVFFLILGTGFDTDMPLKLYIVPVKNLSVPEGEMNAFLRGHRELAVRKEFVSDGENSFWTFCVE
jgi:hypothetical protein